MKGFAGSGKTYLSMKLLKKVDELGLCWTVVAPTHKAVGVLREGLKNEYGCSLKESQAVCILVVTSFLHFCSVSEFKCIIWEI